MQFYDVFIGSFSKLDSAAILRGRLDCKTGEIVITDRVRSPRPSWLSLTDEKDKLLCVCETESYMGDYGGGVEIYNVSPDGLTLASQNGIGAKGPTHFSCFVDNIYAACYSEGAVARIKTNDEKTVEEVEIIRHSGSSVHPTRQIAPHPHFAIPTPDGKYLLVCDLGTDGIYLYPLAEGGVMGEPKKFDAPKGAGPRHAVFSPDGRFLFVVTELDCSVLTYSYFDGSLELRSVSVPPANAGLSENQCGAIKINAKGNELFVTNRGPDSISFYSVSNSAELVFEGTAPTAQHPRDAVLSPDGKLLLAMGVGSDEVWVYSYSDDLSMPLEERIKLLRRNFLGSDASPSCLVFGNGI